MQHKSFYRHSKTADAQSSRRDVYQTITDRIVSQLEAGVRPWIRPWNASQLDGRIALPERHNGTPYRGINVIVLWMEGVARGYTAPRWMTFRQAIELGGCVRKGEKGSLTVYADRITRSETDAETGESQETQIAFMKGYTVFNVEQIEGLPDSYYSKPYQRSVPVERIARADAFFGATGARIEHGGDRAYYNAGADQIRVPPIECFDSVESYYATLAHESTHWTKHESRLDRSFGSSRWGDAGYAMEELVAELGAAFLCANLELTPEVREDHASYLAHWLEIMIHDKRAIFTAVAHAQRAADYLISLQKPAGESAAA